MMRLAQGIAAGLLIAAAWHPAARSQTLDRGVGAQPSTELSTPPSAPVHKARKKPAACGDKTNAKPCPKPRPH